MVRALVLLCLLSFPVQAQEVFRAPNIDLGERFDKVDTNIDEVLQRLDKVEAKNNELFAKLERIEQNDKTLLSAVEEMTRVAAGVSEPKSPFPEAKVSKVTAEVTTIQPVPDPVPNAKPAVQSSRRSTAELRGIVQEAFPGGWTGPRYADVSPRSGAYRHLIDHGYTNEQVSGLSLNEALALHDLTHGGKASAVRSGAARVVVAQTVQQPVRQVIQRAGGCANGQCARQAVSSSYGPLGLIRWR